MNPNPENLTHFDEKGASRMVEVGQKPESPRMARAVGQVRMSPKTQELIRNRAFSKGDVLEVARLAGIMAAKKNLGFDSPLPSGAPDRGPGGIFLPGAQYCRNRGHFHNNRQNWGRDGGISCG